MIANKLNYIAPWRNAFETLQTLVASLLPHNLKDVCNCVQFKPLLDWELQWKTYFMGSGFFFFPSLLACISEVNRINCGTGLPPANQVLGLSTLARVEALGPRGCWGLGWRGGGWWRGLLSWWAVAWVPGADGGRRMRGVTHPGNALQITKP